LRVLLAQPPRLFAQGEGNTCQVQPLGLGYVGAAIAAEHDVRFLLPDTRSYTGDDPWAEIAVAIADEAPDVIGLTAVTADFPAAARFAELAKAVDPTASRDSSGAMPVGASRSRPLAHRSTISMPSRSPTAMVWCGTTTSRGQLPRCCDLPMCDVLADDLHFAVVGEVNDR
jgi:hypothetical protein